MDTYTEQLVKKTPTSSDGMKKTAIITGGVILTLVLLYLTFTLSAFILFAVAIVIYGIYWFLTGLNTEYEYTVTNGSLDVDKIISERKRVSLLTVDVKDFTAFDVFDNQPFEGTTVSAVGGECQTMYAEFQHTQYGATRLLFSPNEKTLESMKPFLRIRK
ncbi:MAG: hypothetical protein IJA12_02475 [Oscillospiraceae bacterium]|nr:hypothetical protein [Oscillospiraceae bacterium]